MVEEVSDSPSLAGRYLPVYHRWAVRVHLRNVVYPQVRGGTKGWRPGCAQRDGGWAGGPATLPVITIRVGNLTDSHGRLSIYRRSRARNARTTSAGASSAMKCPQVTVWCSRSGAQARHTFAAS